MKKKIMIILIGIILFSSFVSSAVNDAVTYYSFDDDDTSGTNSSDISGYGYDGLISGATTGGAGHINEDYSFDGTNDKVTGDDVIDTSSSFSVNFWINPDDVSGRCPLSIGDYDGKVDGIYLTWWNNHNIYVYYGTGASVTSLNGDDAKFVNGEYHMVTVTYDGTTLKLYGDAVLDISNNVNIGDTAFPVLVGDRSSTSSFFSGDIDEVGVWTKTLTPTEIETLYNATTNPYDVPIGATSYFDITALDLYDNTTITIFNATVNGTYYETTNGTIETNILSNSTDEITVIVESNETGGYYPRTYWVNVTTNLEAELHQTEITITNIQSIMGEDITRKLNLTNGLYVVEGNLPLKINGTIGENNITWNSSGLYNITRLAINTTPMQNTNANITNAVNAWLKFQKEISLDEITPTCYNNSLMLNPLVNEGNYYYLKPTQTNYYCSAGSGYQEYNFTASLSTTNTTNKTFNLIEYKVILNFDDYAQWRITDANGTTEAGANTSVIIILSSYEEGKVKIELRNNSEQSYYQFYDFDNTGNYIVNESIHLFSSANNYQWLRVLDENRKPLRDTTVRIEYATGTSNWKLIGRRITNDDGKEYFKIPSTEGADNASISIKLTVYKDGYEGKWITYPFDQYNNLTEAYPMDIVLRASSTGFRSGFYVIPLTVFDENDIISPKVINYNTPSVISYLYTDYCLARYATRAIGIINCRKTLSFTNNVATTTLIKTIDYTDADFEIFTSTLGVETSRGNITFISMDNKIHETDSMFSETTLQSKTVGIILFVLLIILSGMIYEFMDNKNISMGIFGGGMFLLTFINSYFILPTIVFIIFVVGKQLLKTQEE